MLIPEISYNSDKIIKHVFELPTIFEQKEYLNKQIENLLRGMMKAKEDNPVGYRAYENDGWPESFRRNKGFLSVREIFQEEIDALKSVLKNLPEIENATKTEKGKKILPFPKDTLGEVFNNDAIDKFIEIENRLIAEGYFDEQGAWIRTLDECAALINKLLVSKFFLPKKNKIWIAKFCKPFFELRYKIKFSKQMQSKYRKGNKLSGYLLWIEILK